MDSLFLQAITQYLLNSSCRLGSTIGPENKEVTQCMDPACKLSAVQWEEEGGSQTSKAEHSPQAASWAVWSSEKGAHRKEALRLIRKRVAVKSTEMGSHQEIPRRAEGSEQNFGRHHLCPRRGRDICETDQERAAREEETRNMW